MRKRQWFSFWQLLLIALLLSGCSDWSVDQQRQVASYPTCPTCIIPLLPNATIRSNLMSAAILELATSVSMEEVVEFFKTALENEGWQVREVSRYAGGVDYGLEREGVHFSLRIYNENAGTAQQQVIISLNPCQARDGTSLHCPQE